MDEETLSEYLETIELQRPQNFDGVYTMASYMPDNDGEAHYPVFEVPLAPMTQVDAALDTKASDPKPAMHCDSSLPAGTVKLTDLVPNQRWQSLSCCVRPTTDLPPKPST